MKTKLDIKKTKTLFTSATSLAVQERERTIMYQSQGRRARCYSCSEVQCFENPFCGEVQCARIWKTREQKNWKIRDKKKHRFWTTL